MAFPIAPLAGLTGLSFPLANLVSSKGNQDLQRELQENNHQFTERMEQRREHLALQKANAEFMFQFNQGKLSRETQYDIARENREFQAKENKKTQRFQANQSEISRDHNSREAEKSRFFTHYESEINREFQANQSEISRDHNSREAEINRFFQYYQGKLRAEEHKELTKFVQDNENLRQQDRMGHELKMSISRQKQELTVQRRNQEFALDMAMKQNQEARKTAEYKDILDNNPINICPTPLLEEYQRYNDRNSTIPLLMLVSPLKVNFDKFAVGAPGIIPPMNISLEEDLSVFVQKNYRLQSRYIAGSWATNRFKNDTAATNLHYLIRPIPTAILELEAQDDILNLRIHMWNIGSDYITERILSNFNIREPLQEIQKENAKTWENQKQQLINAGVDWNSICPPLLKNQSDQPLTEHQINELNLQQLQRERKIPPHLKIKLSYYPTPSGLQEFSKFLRIFCCMSAGLILDSYHLKTYGTDPKLPQAIAELIEEVPKNELGIFLETLVKNYIQHAEDLYQMGLDRLPVILINMAIALAKLDDRSWSFELMHTSFRYWLKQPQIQLGDKPLLEMVSSGLSIADSEYAQKVNQCLEALNSSERLDIAQSCYERGLKNNECQKFGAARTDFDQVIFLSPHADAYYHRAIACYGLEDYQSAIADLDRTVNLKPNLAEAYEACGDAHVKLINIETALTYYSEAVAKGSVTAKPKHDDLQLLLTEERIKTQSKTSLENSQNKAIIRFKR